MKYYYTVENDEQLGPFTVNELEARSIIKSTYVWTDGMLDWAPADSLDELKHLFAPAPPPFSRVIPSQYKAPQSQSAVQEQPQSALPKQSLSTSPQQPHSASTQQPHSSSSQQLLG
jgi:hypothetical protein